MTKAQFLKQLSLPNAVDNLELKIKVSQKVNTFGFLLYEDFNTIQIIPGEKVIGKVDNILL